MVLETGPYIQAACFCERVLTEGDGVASLIRIVDRITHSQQGPEPPEQMPPISFPLKLVLMLKPGRATGRANLRIVPENPDGSTEQPLELSVQFEGGDRGANVVLDLNFLFRFEGLYWFNVYIGDDRLAAMPLTVRYNRVIISSQQAQ